MRLHRRLAAEKNPFHHVSCTYFPYRFSGTFQDRLGSELRLAGATTIDDANRVLEEFLPRFNVRFGVPARKSEVAYRAVDDGIRLDKVLCFKYRRRVARHNTVRYRWCTI